MGIVYDADTIARGLDAIEEDVARLGVPNYKEKMARVRAINSQYGNRASIKSTGGLGEPEESNDYFWDAAEGFENEDRSDALLLQGTPDNIPLGFARWTRLKKWCNFLKSMCLLPPFPRCSFQKGKKEKIC